MIPYALVTEHRAESSGLGEPGLPGAEPPAAGATPRLRSGRFTVTTIR